MRLALVLVLVLVLVLRLPLPLPFIARGRAAKCCERAVSAAERVLRNHCECWPG
ncbi:hypothetical protein CC85DRAFT_288583, partial [Cutaneotrichosporon oleaginosum]